MKNHEIKIERVCSENESMLMTKGHHEHKAFIAAAQLEADAGEAVETPLHGLMRCVPRAGYSKWYEMADNTGPGVFPVTIAVVYWSPELGQEAREAV